MNVTKARRMNQDNAFDPDLQLMLEPIWFRIEADWDLRKLRMTPLTVVKHTPKGAWLEVGFKGGPAKFVLREMQHRARAYAAPTLDQAREDFRKRKLYRINKLQQQILNTQREINLLEDPFHAFLSKPRA